MKKEKRSEIALSGLFVLLYESRKLSSSQDVLVYLMRSVDENLCHKVKVSEVKKQRSKETC